MTTSGSRSAPPSRESALANLAGGGNASTERTEFTCVLLISAALAVALTWPLAQHLGRIGRHDADAEFSVWNVAWVAHALTTDPGRVFDANIFYPHRGTLAYSENNLAAGALAIPVWLATRNPFAAHNFVVLLAFTLSATGMYYLARYLTGDRLAAGVSAVCFAFCPYVFAHMAHIQLLMTAGLPLAMLAFHRVADSPTAGRAVTLGLVMAAQALACGYYGVFAILMVGFAALVTAAMRFRRSARASASASLRRDSPGPWGRRLAERPWSQAFLWSMALAAVVSIALVAPAFIPYVALQRAGFDRGLDGARFFSPNWSAYLASSSYAHAWMLDRITPWKNEVAFPGFIATGFGLAGIWLCVRRSAFVARYRELLIIYGGLTLLAFWASFGPSAGLYSILFKTIPIFGLLRAPGRFAIIVALGFAIFAGVAVAELLARVRAKRTIACAIAVAAAAELVVPLQLPEAPRFDPVYRVLASLPPGAVIEMPFYYPAVGLYQHTKYMLASTTHWKPLVNGYSDLIPPDFYEHVNLLAPFPSRDAFKILEPNRVRYAVFHMYGYNDENRREVMTRLSEFAPYLRPLYQDESSRLYEIVGFPP
jgi:hypothetical protein